MKKTHIQTEELNRTAAAIATNFKINRSAIQEMYKDDESIHRNLNKSSNSSSAALGSLSIDNFNSNYYNINNLDLLRGYSKEAYAFYPIYASLIDSLSNIFYWRYVFYPRQVKIKNSSSNFEEIYNNMAEVVDGLSLETTMPNLLGRLLIDGSLFLASVKKTGSKTVSTIVMPSKYCRPASLTQYGTCVYQFDLSYFDDLGLTKTELEEVFKYYPDGMKEMYDTYKDDTNLRWQKMNPKFCAGFLLNDKSFPTYLRSLGGIMQYDEYRSNELERNEQQLVKIISHKMPTWEDKLVVEIPEMTALHKSMSRVLTRNKNVRLMTTFGDLDVLSIGEDQSKENKTLANAFAAIFNVGGENSNLFSGDTKEALEFSLRKKESVIWKHVQELVNFYNLIINNHYNFKEYQCSLNMLYLSVYNFDKTILQYKEGATLGVSKLEYIVGLGTKQVDIASKVTAEDYLKLDQLKPLSTSYTSAKNASGIINSEESKEKEKDKEEVENIDENETEIEVKDEQV